MAAALECWSSRASIDEEMVEQVLMRNNHRSEAPPGSGCSTGTVSAGGIGGLKESSSAMQKRLQRLSRNVSEVIASLKNSLNLETVRDSPSPRTELRPVGSTFGAALYGD